MAGVDGRLRNACRTRCSPRSKISERPGLPIISSPTMEHTRSAPAVYRLAIALCLLFQAQAASVIRLYPVDDTARDPAFRAFVKRLRSAVEGRDIKILRKLVDEEVV